MALLAALVRVPLLPGHLWQDEVASMRALASSNFPALIDRVRATESTPPGWYGLAWIFHQLGVGILDLRILSLLFSAAAAALVVVYARGMIGLWPATFAGALAAVGWQFVAHGSELRAYALYSLLVVVFALSLQRAALRRAGRRDDVLLGMSVAAGVTVHYFFLLTVASGFVWLWTARALPRRVQASVAGAAGLAALIPLAPILADHYAHQRFAWIGAIDPLKVAYLYGTDFDSAGRLYAAGPAPFGLRELCWIGVSLVVVCGAFVLGRGTPEGRLCALLATLPVGLAIAASITGPAVFDTRNLLGTAPFAAVTIAAVVARIPRGEVVAVVAVAAAVCATIAAPPFGLAADRVSAQAVRLGWTPDAPIVFSGLNRAFAWPVGWYLPDHVTLRRVPCADIGGRFFLVTAAGPRDAPLLDRARTLVARVGAVRIAGVGSVGPRLLDARRRKIVCTRAVASAG